jgi:hypothetical protein
MRLSWCDKLASTPTIGFSLDTHLAPSASLLTALSPVLNKWAADGDRLDFSIDNLDVFGVTLTSNSGFRYGITQSKISVEFVHRLKMRPTSAGPPVAELTSIPLPFSTLIPQIAARLIEATPLLPNSKTRKIKRIGIVTSTALDEEVMPPGIARFIRYMGRPWHGRVEHYNYQILAELGRASGWIDKCFHIILKTDDPDQLPVLKFDWQRSLDPGRPIHVTVLEELLRDATTSAMAYFEDLAEGNRFDENILRASN